MTDTENKFCINCAHCKVRYNWLWNFLPVIGNLIYLVGVMNSTSYDGSYSVRRMCKKSGSINHVTGKQSGFEACGYRRRYSTSDCKDFLSKSTPLRGVPNTWLLDEIKHRGLFNAMKEYKKESE